LWGRAGQRSLERSALTEAVEQLKRALAQIAILPGTPPLRREQIDRQVALIAALIHVKGYAASETKAAVKDARSLIEQADALGEYPEDPLLLLVVLNGAWAGALVGFNGDVVRDLAAEYLTLAERQGTTIPLLHAARVMGISSLLLGDAERGRIHLDRAVSLHDPTEYRSSAARFGQDLGVAVLSFRSLATWVLGYPDASITDAAHAVEAARKADHAASLMYALTVTSWGLINST